MAVATDVFVGRGVEVGSDIAVDSMVCVGIEVGPVEDVAVGTNVADGADFEGEGLGVVVTKVGFEVRDGARRVDVAETEIWVPFEVGEDEGVEVTCPVIVVWLVSSRSVCSIVVVRDGVMSSVLLYIFPGVLTLVNVALGRNGVKVAVP